MSNPEKIAYRHAEFGNMIPLRDDINELINQELQAVADEFRRNIESRESEYLMDERDVEKAYDRHLEIRGMRIALEILNKHIDHE